MMISIEQPMALRWCYHPVHHSLFLSSFEEARQRLESLRAPWRKARSEPLVAANPLHCCWPILDLQTPPIPRSAGRLGRSGFPIAQRSLGPGDASVLNSGGETVFAGMSSTAGRPRPWARRDTAGGDG
jgi:hypothetical protein